MGFFNHINSLETNEEKEARLERNKSREIKLDNLYSEVYLKRVSIRMLTNLINEKVKLLEEEIVKVRSEWENEPTSKEVTTTI
jgi:DNA polymerase III delta prime subunit